MCFEILKEIVQKGHLLTTDTFSFLLMGCIKDKENGFRYALQVWQQMAKLNLKPDSYTYNLMLNAARTCSLGDPRVASDLLLGTDEASPAIPRLKAGNRKRCKDKGQKEKEGAAAGVQVDVELLEKCLFPEGSGKTEEGNSSLSELRPEVGSLPDPPHSAVSKDPVVSDENPPDSVAPKSAQLLFRSPRPSFPTCWTCTAPKDMSFL
ncbi:hypothetical protein JRQ81_010269 [Phrynocephalus forsythii]|uniref:Pentatricopeptide repeat-containing protein 1 n=1 Tax=Phrynocephalus forsythii TaxID=171643 RepID=A0A9Q0X8T0_9SAUR|nr:hypothetical protein JRQ81_010269 [Phrynocephalus forsythii]